ncbi:MAG TPA: hypothetical protein VKA36_02010 [Solirubrobacterales bacterium]|nr:hypothetical protein [Solirubrobacterales bacterium]
MIYIWIRRTVDWADEQAALEALTDPWLLPKVPLWNETFDLSYQRFRLRVKEIAQRNHERVEGAVPAEWDEIPDDALVVPVDDDDWFRPDAARVLSEWLEPGVTGYHWPARWIEVPIDLGHRLYLLRRRLLPRSRPKWLCSTNNYAMYKRPGAKEPLGSHIEASRWFERRIESGDGTVRRVDAEISVANRTLASQTTLSQKRMEISRSELIRKYRRYVRLYSKPLPPGFEWAAPEVEEMAALMSELQVKQPR